MNSITICRDEDEPEYFVAHVDHSKHGGRLKLEASSPGAALEEARKQLGLGENWQDWEGAQWEFFIPE